MNVRYAVGKNEYKHMTTGELREAFMVDLFKDGVLNLIYCEVERSIVGAAVPLEESLTLVAGKELAADHFCERREVGVLNIGGKGGITVDGVEFPMEHLDGLYIGRGSKEVVFNSESHQTPARFYLISYPAHKSHPTKHAKHAEVTAIKLGSEEDANQREIFQYIHEGGIQSCQLVMGMTTLEPGSVWNTMPCHTHDRRTEVYLYFGLDESSKVFHMMGPENETRHIAVSNEQAVISPMWSIHCGCGTNAYSFCWSMGGENQVFDDMDHIQIKDLK